MGKKLIAKSQVTIQTQNDSYTIVQSVSEYNFTAASNGTINKTATLVSIIRVTQGDTVISDFVIGSIIKPDGFTSITVNNTDKTITYVVNQNTTNLADNGLINIPLTIKGVVYHISFCWSKTKDGAKGATGAAGSSGIDANLLDWVKDWNSNKTVIDSQTVITPKIFTGTKNTNGTVSGVAIGQFNLKTVSPTGTVVTSLVNGIYGFKDGNNTFSVENTGNVQLGHNNQFVRYNATTGKIEFGSEVSLNWMNAINTAKTDAITTASKDASTKADNAKNTAITTSSNDASAKANKAKTDAVTVAANDASTKAESAKNQAISSAANDATNKANKAKIDAITDATGKINAIQIGGSNLLNNSGNWRTVGWNNGFGTNGGGYTIDSSVLYNGKSTLLSIVGTGLQHPWMKLENGVEYTYSAMVLCNEAVPGTTSAPLHCQAGKDNVSQSKLSVLKADTTVLANKWKKISMTFVLTGDANSLRPFFYRGSNGTTKFWIAHMKMERGNVATDWTPSTSDTATNIADAEKVGTNAQIIADLLTKNANDEKWSTKLTHIDASGIFTGTLSANTVNAIKINASQITVGTIDVARINVASLKASLITAGNIEALTLDVTKGKIGGWIIDGDSIYRGTKNNLVNGFTSASGAISIGSNGIRGFKWRLESGGSGALAGGNISWDVSGNVVFGASVSLNWTNAANNALNNAKTYADTKKTEAISLAATDASNKINAIKIGGRNYAQKTSNEWKKYPALTNKVNECVLPYSIICENWIEGDDISVSFDFKYENIVKEASQGCCLRLQGSGNITEWIDGFCSYDIMKYVDFTAKNGETHISYVFALSKEQARNKTFGTNFRCDFLSGSISVRNFMVEKSSKASDWNLSQEDVEKNIGDVNTIATGTQNALGGANYPKLTQITSTGIYTGTLTASQITAGTIHVDRIAAGSINATKLDASSIKANIINTGYINGLVCTFDKGKIGGWTIGSDHMTIGSVGAKGATPIQIRSGSAGSGSWFSGAFKPYGISLTWYQDSNAGHLVFGRIAASGSTMKPDYMGIQMMAWDGSEYFCLSANTVKVGSKEVYNRIAGWAFDNTRIWKNNVSLGADGTISNGTKWALRNDGSGQIADGNISWNTVGAIAFTSAVSLNWTNAISSAKIELQQSINSVKVEGVIYCRGTGMNRNANRILMISGNTIYNTGGGRGLQLTVINRTNLVVKSTTHYDIYGDVVKRTELAKALDALNDSSIIILTSNDAVVIDTQLSNSMARCGGSGIILTTRNPYALVGIPGIGKGKGIEEYHGAEATAPFAEITTRIVNGMPIGFNSTQGLALGNAAVAQAVADAITKKANDEKWGTKLTYIDANGIYTGTLSASTVNALKINATQITAGTIHADRIAAGSINATKLDANSIKANIINTTYINGLSCTFDKGKIGGWNIGSEAITIGGVGTVGATPIQLRSTSAGSGYWYNGAYRPYGLSLTWHQSANAGHFVFGQIAASGNTVKTGFVGIQMMAWDHTEYFCLSANTTKSGSKEIYNRIAGWAFDHNRIWKNNVSLGADGAIYNGNLWRLNNDGSGIIANGNIKWNAAGVITFAASVSLIWTNAATNALNSAKSYADTKKNEAVSDAATDATNKAEAAKELAMAMAFGKMLYRDPTFFSGANGMALYNNSNNGTVVLTRVNDVNAPNDSKQVIVLKNTGASSPGCGGFHWSTQTAYRKVFITRIIAKIPTGRTITYHSNNIGTGGSQKWLTPVAGTGDWKEYICKVTCGTATFQPTNYFAISGAVGTTAAPVEWRIAYATVFDITSTEKYTTTIDGNGIYTGTIRASQVMIDSALVVGGSSYNGSISVRDAANSVKVTLDRTGITAIGGVIGGWNIAATQISKNSVILGSDGTISNGAKWKLANDGSGYVANSNLTWTAAGQVSLKGKIEATEGIIGGFTISGNKLINRSTDSSIQFNSLTGSSSLSINESTHTLLSLRADSARTAISIQTYAAGAKGMYIIANASSTYAIESYGPHKFGQRATETWSAPGVLFSAVCKMNSTLYNQWGNGLIVTRFYRERQGIYVLQHNLGHTQYTVIATPYWDTSTNGHSNSYVRVEFIGINQVNLRIVNADNGGLVDTCFSFAVIGRNKI